MALRCLPSRCRSIARLLSSTQVEPCYGAIQRVVGRASSLPTGVIHGYATDARSAATTESRKTSLPCGQDFIRRFRGTTVATGELITVAVPAMGDSVSEGAIASVEKKPGDVVREDEIIAQIETDKVTIDVKYPFPKPGVVKEILVRVEDVVVVGDAVATVEEGAEVDADATPDAASARDLPPAGAPPPKDTSAPAEAKPAAAAPQAAEPASEQAKAAASGRRSERRVKMTRLRKRVAERLKGAQNTYAMLSTFNEVDMTELMAMRNLYKDAFLEQHGVKLGFMSAFIKAATSALQHVPAVNAVIDEDEILYRDYVDISIAVATPKGLVVPVLRDVDNMSFADVERKMVELGRKARDGTISIDEMAGGTFTVSNGGVFGSMLSTPIINPPQSAILGMHATNMRPMVVNGKVEPRPMMYVALTYDHRLIDGREAVTFLKRVKEVVEDPRRLLLDV